MLQICLFLVILIQKADSELTKKIIGLFITIHTPIYIDYYLVTIDGKVINDYEKSGLTNEHPIQTCYYSNKSPVNNATVKCVFGYGAHTKLPIVLYSYHFHN